MAPELDGGAEAMRQVAAQLRAMADELEAENDLVQSIYVMVAAAAGVSVLAGLVSFGPGSWPGRRPPPPTSPGPSGCWPR